MRGVLAFAFVLLALGISHSTYAEALQIQVADQDLRTIEGAKVEVTYQLNHIQGRITTAPKFTDENGLVNITIQNVEYNEGKTDRTFDVVATYGGKTSSATYTVGLHPSTIVMQVPAYYITVFVRDQNRRVLPATVSLGGEEKATDASGRAYFHVAEGEQEIVVNYNGIEKKMVIEATADASREFVYGLYDLKVKVVDEMGRPLIATVGINGQYLTTDYAGEAMFRNVPEDNPEISARYGNLEKNASPFLGVGNEYLVSFDLSPPVISDINATYASGYVRLRAKIVDEGKYPSGFSEATPFYVDYQVEGNRRRVNMYPVGNGYYEAELQTLKRSSEIPYTISVSDVQGNRNAVSGLYTLSIEVQGGGSPQPPAGGGTSGSGQEGGIDLRIIAAAAVAALGVGVAYWYLRRGEEAS